MRIAIVGAGGVGGYFGAVLARAGHDVIFVARGETLAALRSRPLLVRDVTGDFEVRVPATDDPRSAGPVDLVVLAVKTYDLDEAALAAKPLVGPDTGVLAVQNGVEHGERVATAFGREAALPGATFVVAHREAPGVIRRTDPAQRVEFAPLAPEGRARAERAAEALRSAGVDARIVDDLPTVLWRKLALVDVTSTLGCLTRAPLGVWLSEPESRDLMRRAAREVETVAVALGLPLAGAADQVMATLERVEPTLEPSMLVDLRNGRPLEIDAIQGAVVRYGRERGVATPVNELTYAALAPLHREALRRRAAAMPG
ncbi:MAG TPA: 2-dehydropantoate 2-reductase [Dehalococcoidia bacterium]|nr:2-dehydropantoate 2-reductase [Dehalococcoidia bacterium]